MVFTRLLTTVLMLNIPVIALAHTEVQVSSVAEVKIGGRTYFPVSGTAAEIVIENGTIGILTIKAIIDVSEGRDQSSLIIVTNDEDFDTLRTLATDSANEVSIVLDKPQLKFSLVKPTLQSRHLSGRLDDEDSRIYILPSRDAKNWLNSCESK